MLKASFEVLQPSGNNSFLMRIFGAEAFKAPYHFHPEYELTLITKGEGKRYVGSHMENFGAGDLVLLGANVPHCWKLEPKEKQIKAGAIVIQFTDDFLGTDFFSKPELLPVQKLLQKSNNGLRFHKKTARLVQDEMILLAEEKNNFSRLLLLLKILYQLGVPGESILLNNQPIYGEQSLSRQQRINAVFAYMVENFRQTVSLDAVAKISKMTPQAFCKYFKQTTRKTFMETVIDYRINYATQQLVQTDKPISAICFDSGFGDVSYFNKAFKNKMKLSPLNYRKKFTGEVPEED